MKRVILSVILLSCIAIIPGRARATEVGTSRTFGLGVQILDPTAIIGKAFLNRNNAIDFGIGFAGYGHCYDANGSTFCNSVYHFFSIHFDYLWEDMVAQWPAVKLDWHVGVGGRLVFNGYVSDHETHDAALFARVPLGLDFTFRRPSWLEPYIEIAPGLWVIPPLAFDIDVGLGVRAYF